MNCFGNIADYHYTCQSYKKASTTGYYLTVYVNLKLAIYISRINCIPLPKKINCMQSLMPLQVINTPYISGP